MKKLLFGLICLIISSTFYSCNIINPDEPLPTYIRIDSFNLVSVAAGTHGSVSEKITDAWVYVNNHNAGNFELPADIPILIEGDSAELLVFAGIKADGQSAFRRRYIFYTPYAQRIGKSTQTQHIVPKIEYRTTSNFQLIEDFENGNSFVPYFSPDTSVTRTMDPNYVFEGSTSGLISLDNSKRGARSITTQDFTIPNTVESFMEMDYKSSIPFTVEVQIVTPGNTVIVSDLLGINAREDWNKIYINLTNIGTTYPGSKVSFLLKAALTPGQSDGFVAVDNFKIISQN